jgi:hypothetical protein
MKKFAAPMLAVVAASMSLGATAQAMAGPQGGFAGLLHLNPDPSVAWIMAAGFLGVVVLRRTRSGPMN